MTRMFEALLGFEGIGIAHPNVVLWSLIGFGWIWCNFAPNSFQVVYNTTPKVRYAFLAGTAMSVCFLRLNTSVDFLYFRF
jgi:hypothetical protein